MPRFMLDTDTCSYIVRRSHAALVDRLATMPTDDVCISVVVKAELLYGIALWPRTSRNNAAVAAFLKTVAVMDFPDAAAAHYADIRADLTKRGTLIGANDLFIAAHARCLELTLVTNNVREFSRVKRLTIENWTE
jgi:tRNA(fMet)-specific endonuclease VapC